MCGIIGAFAFSDKANVFLQRVESANDSLQKRGPDGGSIHEKNRFTLGHRRLSVIDVSCAGDQPMTTPDGRYTIVFNGEIFNYQELKSRLMPDEVQSLRSTSDTEVFLLLYARLKEKIFSLLRGFFAAAIADNEKESILIVRDRYGKKPLLYYRDEDSFCFASEMKALFALGVPKEIDWSVLPLYLQLNYIPQPLSIIQNVQKLEPGSYIRITKDGIQLEKYYTLQLHPERYGNLTYEEAQHQLVDVMDEAVRLRLIADVPLGAFLSGGIDSSVVVALASRHTQKLNTFSIGYKDNSYFDETRYAKLVAEKYKTEHTVFSLTNDDFLEHVYSVLDYIDEPFADSSAIAVFILSYYTRKHVTVALSGDGGDEVFAGYNKHAAEWRMREGGMVKELMKRAVPVLSLFPQSRNHKLTNQFRQWHRFAEGARLIAKDRYWQWASFNSERQTMNLLHPDVRAKVDRAKGEKVKKLFTENITGQDFNEVLLADMNLVLLSDMLTKVDLMSMANSLEIRSPFLDQVVVEFAFGLPSEYKIASKQKKKIVQDAFRNLLPEELYNRPKQGFEIPLLGWFRKELWSFINEDLLEANFIKEQRIFDVRAIESLKKQLISNNPGDSHATIWALIVFQYWWKREIG